MLNGKNGRVEPCVLIDLNTQIDFFDRGGACPVTDLHDRYATLRRIVAWAKRNQVPVISSMDCHRSFEPTNNGIPKHCIEGSDGQKKLPFTLLPNRVFVAGDNTLSVPIDLFTRHQQVIFPQRSKDLFANPKADRFLTQLRTEEFILYGAVVEYEVKAVALGLLLRDKKVTVVADGCGYWNPSECDLSLRQAIAKGANVTTAEELLSRKLPRRWRYTQDNLVAVQRLNGQIPRLASPNRLNARPS